MSKKKHSSQTKNLHSTKSKTHHESETKSQEVYEDAFLGKTVELAPNAFKVYKDNQDHNEKNSLVIREKNKPVVDPKNPIKEDTVEKIVQAEAKIEDVLSSLSGDGKKQVAQEIFKNINEEKAEFDAKIKQSNPKANPETLFDKIYTKEFVKPQRTGFFGSIADVFGSDIVWSSVAFALIAGVILFYFQGLQPAILDNYSTKVKNQGNDLVARYSDQITNYFTLSASVSSGFTYEQGVLCSQMKTYENSASNLEDLSRIQFSTSPDQKLKVVENYSYFYNSEMKDAYNQLFLDYSNSLDKYLEPIQNLRDYVRFLVFRNNLIKTCGEIEAAGSNLDQIKTSCAGFIVQLSQFKEDGIPGFWDKVSKSVDEIESGCSSLTAASKNQFLKSFFVQFDEIIFFNPDFTELNTTLTDLNIELVNQKLPAFRTRINNIQNSKQDLLGSFYLLSFEL